MFPDKKQVNFLMVFTAICYAIVAIYLFASPAANDKTNITVISSAFIATGIINILIFSINKRLYFRPTWTLQQGFYLVFFGIILIISCNIESFRLYKDYTTVLSFLAFFSCCSQLSASIQLRTLEFSRWVITFMFSVINLISGVYFITNPYSQILSSANLYAIYLIILAAIALAEPFVYVRKENQQQ